MPLSNNEQRILDEIERELTNSGSLLEEQVLLEPAYKDALDSIKWLLVGCFFGFVSMILMLFINFWISVVSLLAILVCAVLAEKRVSNLRE